MRHENRTKLVVGTVLVCGSMALAGSGLGHPIPAAAAADAKAAGAEVFATKGCAHCHGENGMGTEKGPSVRDLRKKMSADEIRNQIVHGGNGMPAFGEVLQPAEVDDLVAFLRAKKWEGPNTVPAPKPNTQPQPPDATPGS